MYIKYIVNFEENFKVMIPIMPYYSKNNITTTNLSSLIDANSVFTPNTMSGFNDIEKHCFELLPEYSHWTQPKIIGTFDDKQLDKIVSNYLSLIKQYFIRRWDPKVFHFIFSSGGADSRIIGWTLASLRKEGFDLGDFCFCCHHDEDDMFKQAMKAQGWKNNEFHIHKELEQQSSEYYSYGDFTDNHNHFGMLDQNIWSDIVPRSREKEVCVVSGLMGGEQFEYPLCYAAAGRRWLKNPWANIIWSASVVNNKIMKYDVQFHDHLMPYCNETIVDYIMKIPAIYFRKVAWNAYKFGQVRKVKRDLLRRKILDTFGDEIPTHTGHNYIFTLTEATKEYMKSSWLNSKFYKAFNDQPVVRLSEPWNITFKRGGATTSKKMLLDMRMYALATCYEVDK
jgi:hypothetical protein